MIDDSIAHLARSVARRRHSIIIIHLHIVCECCSFRLDEDALVRSIDRLIPPSRILYLRET